MQVGLTQPITHYVLQLSTVQRVRNEQEPFRGASTNGGYDAQTLSNFCCRRSHLVRALSSARSNFWPCLFEAFLPSGMIALFCSVRLPLRSMLEHACCSKKQFSKKQRRQLQVQLENPVIQTKCLAWSVACSCRSSSKYFIALHQHLRNVMISMEIWMHDQTFDPACSRHFFQARLLHCSVQRDCYCD